jgi:hypothetical protein
MFKGEGEREVTVPPEGEQHSGVNDIKMDRSGNF